MKDLWKLFLPVLILGTSACSSFQAQRVSVDESDERALEITDEWVVLDTQTSVKKILEQMQKHGGFRRYLGTLGRPPKICIAEIQNDTSNAYFPIDDFNDELLNKFSASGDFILIDAAAREKILKEITYQNNGMVNPNEVKEIGRQAGADLLIFGVIRMKPHRRGGKTIKQYSVNVRMTDLERGIEVFRTRINNDKYSEQSSSGW